MIIDGVKEGRTVTEIESEICSASNTKWTWNLSVLYETAMMTLAEAIFRLKEIKNGSGRRKKYSIERQYSIKSQGLYELIRAIEKTSIECEEVFAIINPMATNFLFLLRGWGGFHQHFHHLYLSVYSLYRGA